MVDERSACVVDRLDSYKYPVLTLPNEITTEIFLHFLPARPIPIGRLSPLFLCQICRKWREVALSTPSMWSAIHLNLDNTHRYAQQLRLLQTWLERSKGYLLSVALDRSQGNYDDMTRTTQFIEAILPHSARWADMMFVLPAEELPLIRGDMPCLRRLVFGPPYPSDNEVTPFDRAPNLTDVSLSTFFDPFAIVLPWSQITTLAGVLYDYEIAQILHQTPRLEDFRVHVPGKPGIPKITEFPTISPVLHLSTLIVSAVDPSADFNGSMHLPDALALPGLKHLRLEECTLGVNPGDTIAAFVSRIPHLEELRITSSRKSQDFYLQKMPASSFTIKVDSD
jgi:hypothetical protein